MLNIDHVIGSTPATQRMTSSLKYIISGPYDSLYQYNHGKPQ
jgi:hypothetical protein